MNNFLLDTEDQNGPTLSNALPELPDLTSKIKRSVAVQQNTVDRGNATWGDAAREVIPGVASGLVNFASAPLRLATSLSGGDASPLEDNTLFKTGTGDFVRATSEMVASIASSEAALGAVANVGRAAEAGSLLNKAVGAADALGASKLVKVATFGKPKAALAGTIYELSQNSGESPVFKWMAEANSPLLNNAVTRYLANEDDDSEFGRRLGRAVEGLGVGFVGEFFLHKILAPVFKGVKGRLNGSYELSKKSLEEITEHAETYKEYTNQRTKVVDNVPLIKPEHFDAALGQYFIDNLKAGISFDTALGKIKDITVFDGTVPKELPREIAEALGVEIRGIGQGAVAIPKATKGPYALGRQPTIEPSSSIKDLTGIPLSEPAKAPSVPPGAEPGAPSPYWQAQRVADPNAIPVDGQDAIGITDGIGPHTSEEPKGVIDGLVEKVKANQEQERISAPADRIAARDAAVETPIQEPPFKSEQSGTLEDHTPRQIIDEDGEKLYRGMFWVTNQMQGIIGLAKTADFATLQHELFHLQHTLFGLNTVADAALKAAITSEHPEVKFGPNGEWTAGAYEKAAEMYSRYWLDGQAPNDTLKSYFAKVSSWMKDSFNRLDGSIPVAPQISPEVRAAFDSGFTSNEPLKLVGGLSAQVNKTAEGLSATRVPNIPDSVKEDIKSTLTDAIKNQKLTFDEAIQSSVSTLNLKRFGPEGESQTVAGLVSKEMESYFQSSGLMNSLSHEEQIAMARKLVSDLGSSYDPIQLVKDHASDIKGLSVKNLVARSVHAKAVVDAQAIIQKGLTDPSMGPAVDAAVDTLAQVTRYLKQARKEIAQGLESMKIRTDPSIANYDKTISVLERVSSADNMGNLVQREQILRAIAMADVQDVPTVLSAFETKLKNQGRRLLDAVGEWWTNGLLGGVKTWIINLTGQDLNFGLNLASTAIGGVLSGDTGAIRASKRMATSFLQQSADVFEMTEKGLRVSPEGRVGRMVKSFVEDSPILDQVTKIDGNEIVYRTHEGPRRAISNEALGWFNDGGTPAVALNFVGKVVNLPTRMLTAMDDAQKTIIYRAFQANRGSEAAISRGLKEGTPEFADYVSRFVKDSFDANGRPIDGQGLEYARRQLFQGKFEEGSISKWLSDGVAAHPILRHIIGPFIRVPINITKQLFEFTPLLNVAMSDFRDNLLGRSGNSLLTAEARGKLALGTAFWSLAGAAALSGKITGGGPKDLELRNQLLATGWRPYSIITKDADGKDQYFEYRRVEPLATIFGLAADFADVSRNTDIKTTDAMALALTTAVAKNLSSKTFLTTLSETMTVLSNPDPSAYKFLQNRAASYVPNEIAQFAPDDYLREARTMMDAVLKRIPGYADGLPPKRDVLGQKIPITPGISPLGTGDAVSNLASPVHYSKQTADPVRLELGKMNYGFNPPPKRLGDIDLTQMKNDQGQDAYDRYQELTGLVTINGRTLQQELGRIVASQRYQSLPDTASVPEEVRADSGRVQMIKAAIANYRQVAQRKLLKEYPEIQKSQKLFRELAVQAKRPASPVLQRLLNAQ